MCVSSAVTLSDSAGIVRVLVFAFGSRQWVAAAIELVASFLDFVVLAPEAERGMMDTTTGGVTAELKSGWPLGLPPSKTQQPPQRTAPARAGPEDE